MTRSLMGDVPALAEVVVDAATARARLPRELVLELCRGHFPGEPLVPGALIVGIMAELASRLVGAPGRPPSAVVRAAFLRRVAPADEPIELTASRAGGRVDVVLCAAGVRAARATFEFAETA